MAFKITWIDGNREPKNPSDPLFPAGVDLDLTKGGKPACFTALPYPARRCGHFLLMCSTCGLRAMVTTAGRPDDPRSVTLLCKRKGSTH